MNRQVDPRVYARVGSALYLVIIVLGLTEEVFIRGRVTAANLGQMEMLWRAGIAGELVVLVCTIVLSVVIYVLTRPVHRELALLALLLTTVSTAVECGYVIQLVEALLPLGRHATLSAFTPGQLQAMTSLAMHTHEVGFGIALTVFGFFCVVTGYLIFSSGYFPKLLGVLYQLAGVAYVFNGFALVLAPRFAGRAFAIMAGPAFLGETSFAVWLLVKGVAAPSRLPGA
jgi:hypothetical protein